MFNGAALAERGGSDFVLMHLPHVWLITWRRFIQSGIKIEGYMSHREARSSDEDSCWGEAKLIGQKQSPLPECGLLLSFSPCLAYTPCWKMANQCVCSTFFSFRLRRAERGRLVTFLPLAIFFLSPIILLFLPLIWAIYGVSRAVTMRNFKFVSDPLLEESALSVTTANRPVWVGLSHSQTGTIWLSLCNYLLIVTLHMLHLSESGWKVSHNCCRQFSWEDQQDLH